MVPEGEQLHLSPSHLPEQLSRVLTWGYSCAVDLVPLQGLSVFCVSACFSLSDSGWLSCAGKSRCCRQETRVSGNGRSRASNLDSSLFFLGSSRAPQTSGMSVPTVGSPAALSSGLSSLLSFWYIWVAHIGHLWSRTWLLGFYSPRSSSRSGSHILSGPPPLHFWMRTFNYQLVSSFFLLFIFQVKG